MRFTSGRYLLLTLSATLIAPLIAGLMLADDAAAQAPGFAFKRPNATFGVRLGYAFPSAGSDVFDFTREQLTVSSSDFNAVYYGGDLGIRIIEHLDVALSLGYERSDTRSEFRD